MPYRLLSLLLLPVLALLAPPLQAGDNLLPVEEAFALSASIGQRGQVDLHWDIAPDYYLYRGRIKVRSDDAQAQLGELQLPRGKKTHDEFFGDVEIFHHSLDAVLPYAGDVDEVSFTISVQGCHEAEPQICYPPHATKLSLKAPPRGNDAAPILPAAAPTGLPRADTFNLLGSRGANPFGASAGEPLPPEQAFVFEAIASSPTEVLARWRMPDNYYLYRDQTVLSVDGDAVQLGTPAWPQGTQHEDAWFGVTEVYFNEVELPIPLLRTNGEPQDLVLKVEYQGCQDGGICYPVMNRSVTVALPAASAAQLAAAQAAFIPADLTGDAAVAGEELAEDQQLMARLSGNIGLALLAFFGFGLLLAFTPCVFPMVPILSGIIAGAGNITTRRALLLSVVYVLSTSVIFTIAGVVAGLLGANLQAVFQKPWILWSFALLFVLLSLSMFGFYELQLPASWQNRLNRLSNRQKSGSLTGVAVMGMLSALIVGPCVAPPLAAAVIYISQTRDPVLGGLALFALSLGMGAPLVVFGTAAGKLLPRAGAWMNAVKAVFGVSFLALAIWMLSRILDPAWIMLMTGVLLMVSGVYMGALLRPAQTLTGWRTLWQALGLVALLLGAAQLVGVAGGNRDLLQPLAGLGGGGGGTTQPALQFNMIKSVDDLQREVAAANATGRTAMLDFYADWCITCKEMERFTLATPQVHQALDGVHLLKADVTANDELDQQLLKHFELFGPPATLFFNTDGTERRNLRLIGFEKADDFAARVARARQ